MGSSSDSSEMSQEERWERDQSKETRGQIKKKKKVEKLGKEEQDEQSDSSLTEDLDLVSKKTEWESREEQRDKTYKQQVMHMRQRSLVDSILHSSGGSESESDDDSERDYQAETDPMAQDEVDEMLHNALLMAAQTSIDKRCPHGDSEGEANSSSETDKMDFEDFMRELSPEQIEMIQLEFMQDPLPTKFELADIWDNYHVKMPCSSSNTTTVRKKLVPKWPLIQSALTSSPIASSKDLIEAIT